MSAPDPSPARHVRSRLRRVGLFWLLFAAWPFVAGNDYVLSLGIFFFINLLLIGGLNLAMGYGGQISLCQAGFFGLGAYVSGVLAVEGRRAAGDRARRRRRSARRSRRW